MPSREGSPNKNKQALVSLLQKQYPGYQPVLEIAKAAHKLSEMAEQEGTAELWRDAGSMHERVAQYVTPKLKAVEVTGPDGGAIIVKIFDKVFQE